MKKKMVKMNMSIKPMKRLDFLIKIFKFFNMADQTELLITYDTALKIEYPVDWDKLYSNIIKTSEKRYLPLPKYFIDKLPAFRKYPQKQNTDEGWVIIVYFKNKPPYIFENSGTFGNPIIKNILNNKNILSKVAKIIKYPPGTVMIGDKIFYDIKIPNVDSLSAEEIRIITEQKRKELEQQTTIIYHD